MLEEGQQQQQKPLPTQTLTAVKEEPLEFFIHDCKLDKVTALTGWKYVSCPMSDSFIFMGLDKVHHYLKNAQDKISVWYKWNKEKCFCSEPLALCESRSEQIQTECTSSAKGTAANSFNGKTTYLAVKTWPGLAEKCMLEVDCLQPLKLVNPYSQSQVKIQYGMKS